MHNTRGIVSFLNVMAVVLGSSAFGFKIFFTKVYRVKLDDMFSFLKLDNYIYTVCVSRLVTPILSNQGETFDKLDNFKAKIVIFEL